MKSFNFKKVLSVSLASLAVLSNLGGLSSIKVSAASEKNSSGNVVNIRENSFTIRDLNKIIDYNPNVNMQEKKAAILEAIRNNKKFLKIDANEENWFNAIDMFTKLLFVNFKNASGYRGFSKGDMEMLCILDKFDNVSVFYPIFFIKNMMKDISNKDTCVDICNSFVKDFLKHYKLA